jgi:hypothetical protein
MNEKIKEEDPIKTEVRCDVCRKIFAASEADKRCPDSSPRKGLAMRKLPKIPEPSSRWDVHVLLGA